MKYIYGILILVLCACSKPHHPANEQSGGKLPELGDFFSETEILSQDKKTIQHWFQEKANQKPQDNAAETDDESNFVQRYQILLWQWKDDEQADLPLEEAQLKELCEGRLLQYKTQASEEYIFERGGRAGGLAGDDDFKTKFIMADNAPIALVGCSLAGHSSLIKVVLAFHQAPAAAPVLTKKNFLGRGVYNFGDPDKFNPQEQEIVQDLARLGSPSDVRPAQGDGYRFLERVAVTETKEWREKNLHAEENSGMAFDKEKALLQLNNLNVEYQDIPGEARQ